MEKLITLHVNCPRCEASLMDNKVKVNSKPGIKLEIRLAGKKGTLHLSQVYGSYEKKSSILLTEGAIAELYCPECHERLITNIPCKECNAKMVSLVVMSGGGVRICPRVGCKEYLLMLDDLESTSSDLFENLGHMGIY